MENLFPLDPIPLMLAFFVVFLAAFVKGVIGFAMPLIMVSGLTMFLPTQTAIAAIIMPTLVTNLYQGMRGGFASGFASAQTALWPFRRFVLILLGFIILATQIFTHLNDAVLYILLGLPITLFSSIMLMGWRFGFLGKNRLISDWVIAPIAGIGGGIAGIWGPPIVLYLTALETAKKDQVRIQGIIYALCALVFFLAHIGSGIVGAHTLWLSCLLVPIAILGMKSGVLIQDRLEHARFRSITLFILILCGLNMIRKGLLTI